MEIHLGEHCYCSYDESSNLGSIQGVRFHRDLRLKYYKWVVAFLGRTAGIISAGCIQDEIDMDVNFLDVT